MHEWPQSEVLGKCEDFCKKTPRAPVLGVLSGGLCTTWIIILLILDLDNDLPHIYAFRIRITLIYDVNLDVWNPRMNGRLIGAPLQLFNLTAKAHQDFSSRITQLLKREFFGSD